MVNNPLRLSREEAERFQEFSESEGYNQSLELISRYLIMVMERGLIKANSDNPNLLQIKKAQCEGAQEILKFMSDVPEYVRSLLKEEN